VNTAATPLATAMATFTASDSKMCVVAGVTKARPRPPHFGARAAFFPS
jgi:hypothetical protein